MFLLLILVIIGVNLTSSATTLSIPCPRSCDCNHVQTADDRILDIKCFVWAMNDVSAHSLSVVQENFELNLACDSRIPDELDKSMFSYLPFMKSILFKNCQISYVHRHAFTGLPDLESIVINSASSYHLSFHQDAFEKVPKLNSLVLTGSHILKLPNLCFLSELRLLNLSANSLVTFENAGLNCKGDQQLNNLQVIDISNNYFQKLTEMEYLGKRFPDIEIFVASDNDITMTSDDNPFGNFKNLRFLSLSKNKISVLPETLFKSNSIIQEIRISSNTIEHIPSGFFKQSSRLLQLEIQDNMLDDSVWLELADVKSLLYLDVSDNKLTFLNQTTITELPRLNYLNLARNRITSFPVKAFQNQQSLRTLKLDGNNIHTLDDDTLYGLLSLNVLELQNNNIYSINKNVLIPVNQLVHLNISYNNLLELPSLEKLWSLQILDASHNSIDEISEKMFKSQNNIRIINLSNNHITELPDSLFLSCTSLEILDLSNNFIRFFHPSLFLGLNLQTLFLQRNRLQDVGTMFYNLKQLQELNLSSNEITDTIQRSTFPENLVMLDLSYNRIENIRPYSFVGLDKIRMIDLRYNHISTLSKESLKVSTGPYAQTGFRINENPLKCDCNLVWLKQWNQATSGPIIVNLNATRCSGAYNFPQSPVKDVPEERFLCKYESVCTSACKCCDFVACDCKYRCPNSCECYNSADFLSTHYVKCSSKNLTTIDKFIPKIANTLDYSGSDLVRLETHSFIGMTNLETLYLNKSNIKLISNGTFIGLTRLRILYLSNNYIKTLWSDMFTGLDNLENIYLDNNFISVIQDGVFNHIFTLTKLSLHDNFLQYMTDYISSLVFSVEDLELYSNPWICNCILFFSAREQPRAFINMTGRISADVSKIKCFQHSINGLNQMTALKDYRGNCEQQTTTLKMIVASANGLESSDISIVKPNSENTQDQMSESAKENGVILENIDGKMWKDTMKIFIPAIIAATLLFIAVLIVLCRREFLKCWLITKFKCKSEDIELLYDKMRFYDAFIAYHPRDELYVIRDLALRLERGQPKYLLQLQHRDCPSGTSVPNYIDSSVKSSHRTIIVLSKEFMADSMSLKCVLESLKLDSVKRLVVIVLDKVDKTKLDPVIQTIIKNGKSIRYGERFFWQKIKFCLPEPGKVERDNARAEVHPYACTDVSRLSPSMMDNQAYEEPFAGSSLANRPLPAVGEYSSTSQTYHYAAGSQLSSNIYEEIKDHENTSLKYAEPWSDSQLQTNVETLSRASKV